MRYNTPKPYRRILALPPLVAVIVLVATGGGASAGSTPKATAAASQTLAMAVDELGTTLDPEVFQLASIVPLQATEEPFDYYGQRTLKDPKGHPVQVFNPTSIVGGAAKSWKLIPGKSLTMTLRKGVVSPYGNELTTADVKWTLDRNIALGPAVLGGAFFSSVSGVNEKDPITIINKYVFRWNLTAVNPNLLRALNLHFETPFDATEAKKHATKQDPWAKTWLATHTAFFGPYNVTAFVPGQSMTLQANPHYYAGEPPIKTIVMRAIADPATRAELLQSGAVQYAIGIPRASLIHLATNPKLKVLYGPATTMLYLLMNTKVAPWSNRLVRQAVAWALPDQQINQEAYDGTATLAHGAVSPLLNYYFPKTWPYTYNVARAKAVLAKAGFPHGFTAKMEYDLTNPGPEDAQVAIAIQSALKAIGINIVLAQQPSDAAYFAQLLLKKIPFGLAGTAPFVGDAGYQLFNSADAASGFANYNENKQFNADVTKALSMQDGPARAKVLEQAEADWAQDVPMVPVLEPNYGAAMASNLSGFNVQNTGLPRLAFFRFTS